MKLVAMAVLLFFVITIASVVNASPVTQEINKALHNSVLPLGIASFGVSNDSGNIRYFMIKTKEVLGFFNVSVIRSNSSCLDYPYGASLQLNSVVLSKNAIENYTFWIQNVILFNTSDNKISFIDNVWNFSSLCSPLTAIGNGKIYNSSQGQVYIYSTNWKSLEYPFSGYLLENVSQGENYLKLSFGYVIIENGTLYLPKIIWFDNVTIPVNVSSSFIMVAPTLTPEGRPYDVELVFGGPGDGSVSYFSKINASLALFYNNSKVTSFPSIYDFGLVTAEKSAGIHVSLSKEVNVYVGNANPMFLANNFTPNTPFTFLEINTLVNGKVLNESLGYITSPLIEKLSPLNNNTVRLIPLNKSFAVYPKDSFSFYNISLFYKKYIKVGVNLPNGSITYWIPEGGNLTLPSIINNISERYVLNGNNTLEVNFPENITPNYTKEYLVKLVMPNGTEKEWVEAGKTISLYYPYIPFANVNWMGTYKVSNGANVTVNGPINEKVYIHLKDQEFLFLLILVATIILILTVIMVIRERKSKG
jgi:thermopsin